MKILKNTFLFFSAISFLVLGSCGNGDDSNPFPGGGNPGTGSGAWSIPINQVFDGGPGKDGIPALSNPQFVTAGDATYLTDSDLVIGYKRGDDIRAYPHDILDWHEIINDEVDAHPMAITYCPLTGTAIGWERTLNGTVTTFGVSGLLYQSNLIPYDRLTDSNWSQMRLDCVNGSLLGTKVETFQVFETSWATWQQMYPNTKVVSTNTGISRSYGVYPYGDYKVNNERLIFAVSPDDRRIPRKERVLGVVVGGLAKTYRFSSFNGGTRVVEEAFNGELIVVVGNKDKNFLTAFNRKLEDGTELSFVAPSEGASARVIMEDTEGNQWNAFGEAIGGPREGTVLAGTKSYIGFWFAWGAFYPNAQIFEFE
ncbi:DUF3179 domain-containing protein [Fulvivirgaceae bacterium BMA10]|uniref:DUF3179 domain-containing protein n=1 Tax=Splendidivirga corallicola TaxID=3051826 RepID=A0ABT8KI73_9BACT|nr:DUF3179 domain-containing protein [Fulvivirgaceae bacterium BMA10]